MVLRTMPDNHEVNIAAGLGGLMTRRWVVRQFMDKNRSVGQCPMILTLIRSTSKLISRFQQRTPIPTPEIGTVKRIPGRTV
ncbi:hypothetical protein [Desulfocurvus sp. DL9XJH121]